MVGEIRLWRMQHITPVGFTDVDDFSLQFYILRGRMSQVKRRRWMNCVQRKSNTTLI
jgi:hypothetical protein